MPRHIRFALAACVAATLPTFAAAQMVVTDPYARASTATAASGAAFMIIENQSDIDDRVVSASSDVAQRVELHTHIEDDGVMRMVEVEEGFELPAGGTIHLARGGLHVMFLGLTQPFIHGEDIELTLSFETAPPLTLTVPIDLERQDAHGGHGGHSTHGDQGDHGGHDGHGDHDG